MKRKKQIVGIVLAIIVVLILWCVFIPKDAYKIVDCSPFCCSLNDYVFTLFGWEPICPEQATLLFGGFIIYDSSGGWFSGGTGTSGEGDIVEGSREGPDEPPVLLPEADTCIYSFFTLGCAGECLNESETCRSSGLFSCSCQLPEREEPPTPPGEEEENCDSYCAGNGYDHGARIYNDYQAHYCDDSGGDIVRSAFSMGWFSSADCCCFNPSGGHIVDDAVVDGEEKWCWDTDGGFDYTERGVCFENTRTDGYINGEECDESPTGWWALNEYKCITDSSHMYFGQCELSIVNCPNCSYGICPCWYVYPHSCGGLGCETDYECIEIPNEPGTSGPACACMAESYTLPEEPPDEPPEPEVACGDSEYPTCDGTCPEISGYIGVCESTIWYDATYGVGTDYYCECRYYDNLSPEYYIGDSNGVIPDGEKPCSYGNSNCGKYYCPEHKYMEGTCTYTVSDCYCLYELPCGMSYPNCDGFCKNVGYECSKSGGTCSCMLSGGKP